MNNTIESAQSKMPPGKCFLWEDTLEDGEKIAGDVKTIKSEWEKLDSLVYQYIWWWVHR